MDEYEVRRADGLLQDALLKKYYSGDDLGTLVAEAKHELDVAQNNFDNATDKVLVDLYIYQLKVAQIKYKYVLNMAKEQLKAQ